MTYLKDLKPGLYHLDLNINQYDTTANDLKIKELEASKRRESEYVRSVLKLWIARIKFSMYPREQDTTIKSVREILKFDPTNLNALADLCQMCTSRHIDCSCEQDKLNEIITSDDLESKATCLLEQTYVQLFSDPACPDQTALRKMVESRDILTMEYKHCSTDRKRHIQRAMRQLHIAISEMNESLCCLSEGEKTDIHMPTKMQTIIEQFTEGVQSIENLKSKENKEKMYVWKYYMAMAYNRADWSIRQDAIDDTDNRAKATLMCLELFWLVGINSQQQFYRGRSFVYIGHALQARRDLLADHHASLIKRTDPDMERYSKSPLEACEKAFSINESDPVVLTRYAKVLLNSSMFEQHDENIRFEMLIKSKSFLDKSLKIDDSRAWFSYVTRMLVYKQLGLKSSNKTEKEKYLKLALDDGEVMFKNKYTIRDLCDISKICQILAKFPNQNKFGHEYVTNPAYLKDAVVYLSYAIDIVGFRNYHVNFNMGQCYYEMCEFRKAVEWMKRALETSDPKREQWKGFSQPYRYMLQMYKNEAASEKSFLFSELKTIMTLGFSKYGTIAKELAMMCNCFRPEMEKFLSFMRRNPFKNKILRDHVLRTCRETFGETLELIAGLDELQLMDELEAKDDLRQLFSFSENRLSQPSPCDDTDADKSFTYDFFVSHSKTDVDWVTGVLIPALETTSFEFDIQLKGCYEDRDFEPGISILDNIVKAVKESRKILLVCSPEYLQKRWKWYETEQALMENLNTGRDNIIPIKLRSCEIPSNISHIIHTDLSNELETSDKLRKLKRAII